MRLQIDFNILNGSIDCNSYDVYISNVLQKYDITDKAIVIDCYAPFGFHMLRLKQRANNLRIDVTDVTIDGVSVRQFIWLSWLNSNKKIQPCTKIWEKEQEWILPFAYPVCHLFDIAMNNFENGSYGKDLWEEYHLYYPESNVIPDTFPQLIKDFFKYNNGFTAIHKSSNALLPIQRIDVDEQKLDKLRQRTKDCLSDEILTSLLKMCNHSQYNTKEDSDWDDNYWNILSLASMETGEFKWKLQQSDWPEMFDFIDSLGLKKINGVAILNLHPGKYVAPHRDDKLSSRTKTYGQFYIPINVKAGNYIKMSNVGTYDLSDGAYIINNQQYTHSVINTSDEIRSVLAVVFDLEPNMHIFGETK